MTRTAGGARHASLMTLAVILHAPTLAAIASSQMLTRSTGNLGLKSQWIPFQNCSYCSLTFRQRIWSVLAPFAIAAMVAHPLCCQALAIKLETIRLLAAAAFRPLWLSLHHLTTFALAARRAGAEQTQARTVTDAVAVCTGTYWPG